ncbi:GNAT family N-acetyltransferase [Flavobacterium sp. LS1R47]|jgi:GNAT superfamily N-acetyltransferase|uniref:GNAT family N-acetyltransferase n=1 Tax=Flavobacterium frigoritolerans TaxID=2987686 RepID=A0A9X3C939_9FLAO|nr:GNAT family N-acetyltransferase [Flavobacterium frigoritolerans]MCV9933870.1 GNAT family N-acetyltransferase [Flavobacterium frigoritolerans]
MNIIIVPIKDDYSEAVVDLILNIQQKEFNVPITLEDQPDLLEINQFYHKKGGCFWGAFIDGELVGTIALVKYDDREGAIRKMFVKKEYRGKELYIAQQLLDTLIAYSKQNGLLDLYLGTVSILEAALRFYERNNFVRIEKGTLPDAFPIVDVDNVFCHLKLN